MSAQFQQTVADRQEWEEAHERRLWKADLLTPADSGLLERFDKAFAALESGDVGLADTLVAMRWIVQLAEAARLNAIEDKASETRAHENTRRTLQNRLRAIQDQLDTLTPEDVEKRRKERLRAAQARSEADASRINWNE